MFSAAACKEHYIAVSETHNLQEKQNQNVLGYLTYRDISHVSLWIGFGSAGLFPSLFFINHPIHHQQELELVVVVGLAQVLLLKKGHFCGNILGAKHELHRNRREFYGCNRKVHGKASFRKIQFSHSKTVNSKL